MLFMPRVVSIIIEYHSNMLLAVKRWPFVCFEKDLCHQKSIIFGGDRFTMNGVIYRNNIIFCFEYFTSIKIQYSFYIMTKLWLYNSVSDEFVLYCR